MSKPRVFLPLLFVVAFFAFQGTASAAFFDNTSPITINQRGPASPNPSTVNVAGQQGPITDVKVTLFNLGHTRPGNLDILLVSPTGQTSILMSDTCDLQGVEDKVWTFSTGSPGMGANCPSGGFSPTNAGDPDPDEWPGAPAGPHTADLKNFNGLDPNGQWKLYVMDDGDGFEGDIETGWVLTLKTKDSAIKIPGAGSPGPADPYPSTQTVTGEQGVVSDVNIVIPGIFHKRPDDIDALLVGPDGQKVKLMSDACGNSLPSFTGWIIDDDMGAIPFPDGDGCAFTGRYKPTDYEPGEDLPAPAPPGPYADKLSAFSGSNPNGEWKLFVADDTAGETGWIENPYQLQLTTRTKAAVSFNREALVLSEGDNRSVTVRRSASSATGTGSVRVTSTPGTATSGQDFTPVSTTVNFAPGETEKTVPVAALVDRVAEPAETFSLTIANPTGDATVDTPARVDVTIDASTADEPRTPRGDNPQGGGEGDRTAPTIGGVKLFRRGRQIRYSLSERARVTMRVQRRAGRRWVRVATLKQTGRAGINRKRFSRRVGRRVLRRGRYRLIVTAADSAGNRATAKPRRFRIVRR